MNKNLLLAKMLEHDKTAEELCKACEISLSAFTRKVNGRSQFKQREISVIMKALELTSDDVARIFFR